MKKERVFYLDFIRAIAVVAILLTHYNAVFVMAEVPQIQKVVLTYKVCNLYIGDFGVTLFFIISGAALMHVYEEKIQLKNFYKKRFCSIYPMFWLAYFVCFLYTFYTNKGFDHSIPKRNIILSIIGFDGYSIDVIPNFYLLGEWFVGCIILIYVVFPLLRIGVNRYPKITVIIAVLLYIWSFIGYHGPFNKVEIITTRIPEILFGMYFVKYIKKVPWQACIGALVVLVVNTVMKPKWDASLQTTYIGIASFCVLTFVSSYITSVVIRRICFVISKYSYAVFLTHHVIITKMTGTFNIYNMTRTESYLLFLCCCMVIMLASYLLLEGDRRLQSMTKGLWIECSDRWKKK